MLEELKQSIIDGDNDEAAELAAQALAEVDAVVVVNEALVPAMDEVANLWQEGEFFMSDVILCANAFSAAIGIVSPALAGSGATSLGKVVIGVVEGDLHDLGKDIVVAMLKANGFEVIDLGIDVSLDSFVDAVRNEQPSILGIGAYMSTTQHQIKDIVDALAAAGLRSGIKIIVGGVCINEATAKSFGADGWGKDAMVTVGLAKEMMEVA